MDATYPLLRVKICHQLFFDPDLDLSVMQILSLYIPKLKIPYESSFESRDELGGPNGRLGSLLLGRL